jgi:flagellar biosynthesis/type III secretory pathway M-ring protein FliF/YscJ
MEARMLELGKTLEIVTKQLRGFSATAKLLIGSLMVIMVLGLVIVAMVAGRPEMVPLGLGGAHNVEARARAVSYLQGQRVRWEEVDGDIVVPVDEKHVVLGELTENQLITAEQIDFTSIMKESSPFEDRQTRSTRYLVAKMNEVARMISSWSVVERADVKIAVPHRDGGIGQPRIKPTASVTVFARGDVLSQTLVDAVASTVAGSHADLETVNVSIVDGRTGRAMRARSEDELASGQHLDTKQAQEKHHKTKLERFLSYIPGVRVEVNAQVETSEVVTHRVGVDEPKLGVTDERSSEKSLVNQSAPAEPGVRANAGEALAVGSRRSSQMSETSSATKMIPAFGTQDTSIRRDRGYALKINATIDVPRSWFVGLYRHQQGDPEVEPDATALDLVVAEETQRLTEVVVPLIDTTAMENAVPGTVVVSMFNDIAPGALGVTGIDGGGFLSGGSSGGLVSEGLVKSIGLGGLAVVSLFLMFMMVRRASREEEMPTAEELVGIPPALAEADADLVGEADETVAAMEGVEIEEGAVRRQQMIDQINELAVESSDEAASLLRKWIKTDD